MLAFERQLAKLIKWLGNLSGIVDVEPVLVKISGHRFYGASYGQCREYSAEEKAVQLNLVAAGQPYVDYRLYLLGEFPRKLNGIVFCNNVFVYKQTKQQVNVLSMPYESTDEWYCFGYWAGGFNENHPMGSNFILGEHKKQTFIDDSVPFFETSRPRNKMSVRFLKAKVLREV
jgi:hypothetical protein